ncbi:MAG: GIY-YIG nuclease family protein [Gracilimonas sp.]|nr:GIY-YIG nuclease family protein [Gracilimonas sp.]
MQNRLVGEENVSHTYIIYSESTDTYYVGSTGAGVRKRVERHNEGLAAKAKKASS